MKPFSKLALATFLPLSLLSLASCSKTYYSSAKRIAPFFHEITYNDYEEDPNFETLNPEAFDVDFGCTSVRNGDLYGRNYDFYYSNSPSILVKMKGNNNRFKSIGIANHLGIEDSDLIVCEEAKTNQHTINIIPNFMTDGINEKGVVCNMNIVNYDDGGGLIEHTNPGKPPLIVEFALRYILDNATSAYNAVELLRERDIFVNEKSHTTVHIMVADANETYIIEFIKNKSGVFELRAEPKTNEEQIMTNFYNNMTDDEEKATYKEDPDAYKNGYNNHASGTERYEFVEKNYKDCETLFGMWSVLHDIRFSQMYLNPDHPDYPTEDFSQEEIKKMGDDLKQDPELLAKYRSIYNFTRFVLDSGRRDLGFIGDTWITMHSAIYNIKEKTLNLNVQEDYLNTYTYDLNF